MAGFDQPALDGGVLGRLTFFYPSKYPGNKIKDKKVLDTTGKI
jgi:hypothetical protein